MRKTPEQIKNAVVVRLAEGKIAREIARELRIGVTTVYEIRDANTQAIRDIQKAVLEKVSAGTEDTLAKLAQDMLKTSELALNLILKRMDEASPAQAAVILGIMMDKYNNLCGRPSQVVGLRIMDRAEMIGYIKGTSAGASEMPVAAIPLSRCSTLADVN